MPKRTLPFVTGEIYHIFNKGVGGIPIFENNPNYNRVINLIDFYRFESPKLRFSHYNRLNKDSKEKFLNELHNSHNKLVEIYSFSLMPNHYHFLLKQTLDGGIPSFAKKLQNAYAKYFNTKNDRNGSLFQLMFKGVRIENDDQFMHVLRYIHINPLTSFILTNPEDLINYKWTSFSSYMRKQKYGFVNTEFALKMFGNKEKLKKFTFDHVDYQRRLAEIKHLMLE